MTRVLHPVTLDLLRQACDRSIKAGGNGWVISGYLGGTKQDRSTGRLQSLITSGHAQGSKLGEERAAFFRWRITDAGRRANDRWREEQRANLRGLRGVSVSDIIWVDEPDNAG